MISKIIAFAFFLAIMAFAAIGMLATYLAIQEKNDNEDM